MLKVIISKYLVCLLILPLFILTAFASVKPALAWTDVGPLVNGNFDQGWVNDPNYDSAQNNIPSGWSPDAGTSRGWKRETGTYINSCCSAKHSGAFGTDDSSIWQTFSVTPGAVYRIFGRSKRFNERSADAISYQFGTGARTDELLYFTHPPSSQEWYYFQFDVEATASPMTLWLNGWTNPYTGSSEPNDVYFDDVSVIKIADPPPPPSPTPTPTPTPAPTVLPTPTWVINAIPVDYSGNPVTFIPVRLFYAIWPPNPLTWIEDTAAAGTHTRTISITNDVWTSGAYIGLESATGSVVDDTSIVYTPYGSPPNSLIHYSTYFNPPTWMAKFNRDLPSGTYNLRFIVPVPPPLLGSLIIGPNTNDSAVGAPPATYWVSGLRADDPALPANSGQNYMNSLNITPHITGVGNGDNITLAGAAFTQSTVSFTGGSKLQDLKTSADANNGLVLIYANKDTVHTAGPTAGTGPGQSGCPTYNFCAGRHYFYYPNGSWQWVDSYYKFSSGNEIAVRQGANSREPLDVQFSVRLYQPLDSRTWGTYGYVRDFVSGAETATAMTPIAP